MVQRLIQLGSVASDSAYESSYGIGNKVNLNFAELYPASFVTLTEAAPVVWATDGIYFPGAKLTLTAARTLSITGLVNGQRGTLIVTQNATGGFVLTLPASGRVSGTPTTTANAVNLYDYVYDGAVVYWKITPNLIAT